MALLGDLAGQTGISAPSASTVTTGILYLLVFLFLMIIFGALAFWVVNKRKFYILVVPIRKINGTPVPGKVLRAMEVSLSQAGDRIIWVKGIKKYLPMPTLQTGKDKYYFFVTDDDEWINIRLQDIDIERRELKMNYLDKEMRFARVALQRNLMARFKRESIWDKYGTMIVHIAFIIITLAAVIFIMKDFKEIAGNLASTTEAASRLVQQAAVVSSNSGGAGIAPA